MQEQGQCEGNEFDHGCEDMKNYREMCEKK